VDRESESGESAELAKTSEWEVCGQEEDFNFDKVISDDGREDREEGSYKQNGAWGTAVIVVE